MRGTSKNDPHSGQRKIERHGSSLRSAWTRSASSSFMLFLPFAVIIVTPIFGAEEAAQVAIRLQAREFSLTRVGCRAMQTGARR